ncbi:hypothetical protein AYO21_00809 [Fonsecaea monophora]|uniref:Clr5 domain-containing protein n=1 Tax=Fonsecaea monophora TaxID=254056 RepID=A0A177FKX7_9EURO|nr:hypothetical protein AYO21_00809 [Fonsecaea monophora]KAH0844337.1 hypothetical protein FOPE_09220 [Fonsecaea pedrosoi]OAG44847.1 hypothetical protein AYO21_00809 [Fonsecaea monophora]
MSSRVCDDVADSVWESHRDTIRTFYLVDDHSLEELMREMASKYDFRASKAQFEAHLKKWDLRKNLTKDEWKVVTHKIQKRKRDNKDSEVCSDGFPMNAKKVKRAITRYRPLSVLDFDGIWSSVSIMLTSLTVTTAPSPRTPEGITIQTPVLAPAALTSASPKTASFIPISTTYVSFLTSSLPFAHFNGRINLEVSRLGRSLENVADSELAENPYASSPRGDGVESTSSLEDLESSIVGYFKNEADGDEQSKSFRQNLRALIPDEVLCGQPSQLDVAMPPSAAVNFLNLTQFMISNKLFETDSKTSKMIYNWIKRRLQAGLFEILMSVGGPTIEALRENIFSLAIEQQDAPMVEAILRSGLDLNQSRIPVLFRLPLTPLQRACELGSLDLVQILLDAGADIQSAGPNPESALTHAIRFLGNEYIMFMDEDLENVIIGLVQLLLDAHANVNPGSNESPLFEAARSCLPQLVEILLSAGADPNFASSDTGSTPLFQAVGNREAPVSDVITVVRHLLRAGANVHVTTQYDDKGRLNLLGFALDRSSVDLIQLLLEADAPCTEENLLSAVGTGKLQIIKLLSTKARITTKVIEEAAGTTESKVFWSLWDFADNNTRESSRGRAFVAAIRSGNYDLINAFSACGVQLANTSALTAAIEAAAGRGDIVVLRLLLSDNSAFQPIAVHCLGTSLLCAIAQGRDDVIEMLLAAGADVNAQHSKTSASPLLESIRRGAIDLSRRLLAAGAEVNMTAFEHCGCSRFRGYVASVLPAAVSLGYHPLIQEIIETGADVDAPEPGEERPALTVAVEKRDLTSVRILIDAGADVNTPAGRHFGQTALAAAIRNKDVDTVHYLLRLGADPDEWSLIAAVSGGPALMQLLLTAKFQRFHYYSCGFGCRALQKAIKLADAAMVELLLSNGINPSTIVRPQRRQECYSYLAREGAVYHESAFGTAIRLDKSMDLWMVRKLLNGGVDPNKRISDQPNGTALLQAIRRKSFKLAEMLVIAGAEVNTKAIGSLSRTPLQLAAEQGCLDMVEYLLQKGADVNSPPCDQSGATALQLAAYKGYLGIACLLLNKGAEIDALPAKVDGKTALEGASEDGRIDMVQLLLNGGAQVVGPGSRQYERARQLASSNGHIAVRRLLEANHAQQLNALSDLIATDVENSEALQFGDEMDVDSAMLQLEIGDI